MTISLEALLKERCMVLVTCSAISVFKKSDLNALFTCKSLC